MGVGLRFVWKEFRAWMAEWQATQDKARADEREKQRIWEAAQSEGWQRFLQEIESHHGRENERNRSTLSEAVESMKQIAMVVQNLNQTVTNHILEDNARFAVLLSREQHEQIERMLHPEKKGKGE